MSTPPLKPGAILLGSIALEPRRWGNDKRASFSLSAWLPAIQRAGFDGIELWDRHYLEASAEERAALINGPVPLTIFNSYARMDSDGARERERDLQALRETKGMALKFNLGADNGQWNQQMAALSDWATQFPADARLLCECHPGTIVETPTAAAAAFDQWPDQRIQAIIHPLRLSLRELDAWFEGHGDRITHAHLQMRDSADRFLALDEDRPRVSSAIKAMRKRGFLGSWTIEFVKGTRTPEDMTPLLFERAATDLATLRDVLGEASL